MLKSLTSSSNGEVTMSATEMEAWRLHRRIVFARRELGIEVTKVSREGLGLYLMNDRTLGPYQVLHSLGRLSS
jgi:hypothetical protein